MKQPIGLENAGVSSGRADWQVEPDLTVETEAVQLRLLLLYTAQLKTHQHRTSCASVAPPSGPDATILLRDAASGTMPAERSARLSQHAPALSRTA